ncbi:ABC transporter permease [Kineococcus glutinatus]|uniref:ABC transporter permease subunit n=1 Tax=Kineococcus glutinatus TaxID=1070872 RepID=A0ABP8VAL1_9ACTN
MSTTTLDETPAVPQYRPPQHRLTFGGMLRSEWIKFWSVRSVLWTMIGAVVCTVGIGALISWGISTGLNDAGAREEMADGTGGQLDLTLLALSGAQFASLVVAAIGAIVIAGEISTGMVRTTFTAAPRRLAAFAAKALVLTGIVLVVMALADLAAFFIGQAIFSTTDITTPGIGDEGVLRAVLGTAVMQTGIALAGLGLGALLRNSAGTIVTMAALVLVVPGLLQLVPESWNGDTIREYYFVNTATSLTTVAEIPNMLSVWVGAAWFAAWVAAFLVAGALRLKRRDV